MNCKDAPLIYIWTGFVKSSISQSVSDTWFSCRDSRLAAGWSHIFDALHTKLCYTVHSIIHSYAWVDNSACVTKCSRWFGMPFYWHNHDLWLIIFPWNAKASYFITGMLLTLMRLWLDVNILKLRLKRRIVIRFLYVVSGVLCLFKGARMKS